MTRNANAYAVSVRDNERVEFPRERIGLRPATGSASGEEACQSGSWNRRERCRLFGDFGGYHGDASHPGKSAGEGSTIVLLADIVHMVDDARIGDAHVKMGLVAGDGANSNLASCSYGHS